jgi:hypothetical protein
MANKQKKGKINMRGEYELLSDSSPSRNEVRRGFLKAIRLLVLPSLHEGPFPVYESSLGTLTGCLRSNTLMKATSDRGLYHFWNEFAALAKENPELAALSKSIIGWARSHNLLYQRPRTYAVWLLDQTLYTLNYWHWHSWYKDNLEWEYFSLSTTPQAQTKENPPFEFKHPAWDCFEVSRADYKNWISQAFKYCLRKYLDSRDIGLQEDLAKEIGIVKPMKKREGGETRQWSRFHLDWFVHFQLERIEPKDIASLYSLGKKPSDTPTANAVWAAICDTALLIGLEPRPSKSNRGRQRKICGRRPRK